MAHDGRPVVPHTRVMTATRRSAVRTGDAVRAARRSLHVRLGRARFDAEQLSAERSMATWRSIHRIATPSTDRVVLIHAHPRSGSTLLANLLASHPEIAGYGEHHTSYRSRSDVERLELRLAYFARDPRLACTYVLDKIVWNDHIVSDEVLNDPATFSIFLLRHPRSAIPSYREFLAEPSTDAHRLDSYAGRLDGMIDLATRLADPSRGILLQFEDLTERTTETLAALTRFLELPAPLSETYEPGRRSHRRARGDTTPKVASGSIDRTRRTRPPLDPDLSRRAASIHRRALDRLEHHLGERVRA